MPDPQSDLDQLQGTWKITSLELDGMKLPAILFPSARISVTQSNLVSTGLGAAHEGLLELDESSSPKGLRIVFTRGPEEGNINRGIYELTLEAGEPRWRICLAIKGGPAPTGFSTSKGSGHAMQILRRA